MQQEFHKPTAFASALWLPMNWSFPCPDECSNGQKAAIMQKAATTDVWQPSKFTLDIRLIDTLAGALECHAQLST